MRSKTNMPAFVILEKKVGETPLECLEAWRLNNPEFSNVPLAYAGRLDPMAEGKLLVLLGDECKRQESYHNLDKNYVFSILLGIKSDSKDILGLVNETGPFVAETTAITSVLNKLSGEIELPYPIFSAKTVKGKPLHTWAVEGRLEEITIPTRRSTIYQLKLVDSDFISRAEMVKQALAKIALLPKVTDPRKALGNDFRRGDILPRWQAILKNGDPTDNFQIITLECLCSAGTYMRTLAEVIGSNLGSSGLAWKIKRTEIGIYNPEKNSWDQTF